MNNIVLKGYSNIRDEKVAAGTIKPGHLVERTSADAVIVHATAGGSAESLFAVEDSNQGNGITDDYSSADRVMLISPTKGEQIQGIAGATIAIGDFVESAGDGRLRVAVGTAPASLVGVALEAAVANGLFAVGII